MCGKTFTKDTARAMDDLPLVIQYIIFEEERFNLYTYGHIISEHRRHAELQWMLRTNRIVPDPFFALMESTAAVRRWILRNTPWLPEEAHLRNGGSILAYFESMGREEALRYFRIRQAPMAMINIWRANYPVNGSCDLVTCAVPLDEVDEESEYEVN